MNYENLINVLYHYGIHEDDIHKAANEIIDMMYEVE